MLNPFKASVFVLAFSGLTSPASAATSNWIQTALDRFEREFTLSCSMVASSERCEGDLPNFSGSPRRRSTNLGHTDPNHDSTGACYAYATFGCAKEGRDQVEIITSSVKTRLDREFKLTSIELKNMQTLVGKTRVKNEKETLSDTLGAGFVQAWLESEGARGLTVKKGDSTKWRQSVRMFGDYRCKRRHTYTFADATVVATERGACPPKEERASFGHSGFIERLDFSY